MTEMIPAPKNFDDLAFIIDKFMDKIRFEQYYPRYKDMRMKVNIIGDFIPKSRPTCYFEANTFRDNLVKFDFLSQSIIIPGAFSRQSKTDVGMINNKAFLDSLHMVKYHWYKQFMANLVDKKGNCTDER